MDIHSADLNLTDTGKAGDMVSKPAGYRVFYGDSREESILSAMSYIQSYMPMKADCNRKNIKRPRITFKFMFSGLILPALLQFIITIISIFFAVRNVRHVMAARIAAFMLTIKHSVILSVLLYQKYAPERIRNSCRFQPSCSDYMLQAIEKYGFLKGFAKGIGRLFRCRQPNGGVDLP